MAKHKYRQRRQPGEGLFDDGEGDDVVPEPPDDDPDGDLDDEDPGVERDGPDPDGRRGGPWRRTAATGPAPRRPAPVATSAPAANASSLRMKGNDQLVGYLVAGVLAVVAVILLTVRHGAGAPAHPNPLPPAIGLVLAVILAATIRLGNRLVSGLAALFSGFACSYAQVPKSLKILDSIALFAALGFTMMLVLRQSKDQRLKRAASGTGPRTRQSANGTTAARAGTRRGRKNEPEPTGPRPNSRYTPPKPRPADDDDRRSRRARR